MSRFASRRWLVGAATLGLVLLALLAPVPPMGPAPTERRIRINAHTFEFTPSIVHVNRGDTVQIELQAEDVVHGLYVDGYDVSTQAEPGQPAVLSFVADRAGAFHMRCAVPCGNLHPFMIGKLVVDPNLTWLRAVAASVIAAISAMAAFWKA